MSADTPVFTDTHFVPAPGKALPLRRWLPTSSPNAVIIALHGFNDYSVAFQWPAEYLAARGIAFYAYDQRGFGANTAPGIWPGEHVLVNDARAAVIAARHVHPKIPLYLMGESMGGAVALLALEDNHAHVDGAILVAPALWGGRTFNGFYRACTWLASQFLPWKTFSNEVLGLRISDNNDALQSIARDPLFIKHTRADAMFGVVELMDRAYSVAMTSNFPMPLLVLYGGCDQIIPEPPIRDFATQLQSPQKFIYYPEGYHLLLRGLAREHVFMDMVRWLTSLGLLSK